MNGLLHRLAARAAGTTTAVRSDARLPFGAAGAGLVEGTEPEGDAAWTYAQATAETSALPDTTPMRDVPTAAEARSLDPRPMAPRAPIASSSSTIDGKASPLARAPATEARADGLPAAAPSPGVPTPARLVEAAPRDSATATLRAATDAAPIASAMRQQQAAQAEPRTIARHPSAATLEPPRLMPAASPPSRAVVPPVAASRAAGATQAGLHAAAEPHEVHVHIGRIDVTAVHEPPAPRRRAPAAPTPMSLDAYLAQRSRS